MDQMCESMDKNRVEGASAGRAGNLLRSPYPSRVRSVDPATVHRRRLSLPQEICSVSLRRLRLSRGSLTAEQKSAEGIVRAEQRAVQEGSSPSGARMRSAISKSGGHSSLAGEGGRYGEAYTGTKAKAGYSQGEPEAISCKSPEGRVSTVRGIRRACGEVPGRSRWGNPRRTGRLVSRKRNKRMLYRR